jgi:uncharacterized protein YkwD
MPPKRSPLVLVALAVTLAILIATPPALAGTRAAREKMFHFVNTFRREHGRHALQESADVDRLAQHHSKLMAADRTLFHSSGMWTKLRAHDPTSWGEDVGMGSSAWRVYKGWTRSDEHRANMLARRFKRAGVGVVSANGALWVTMIFYG